MTAIAAASFELPLSAGVLAGGEGRRMAGADKGLLHWRGRPLVQHVLAALKPQSMEQFISANRNIEIYAGFGVPVLPDGEGSGPLAGVAELLAAANHDWLLCVPCDAPLLPADIGARLLQAAQAANARASVLHDGERMHPTFCLMHRRLAAAAREAARRGAGFGEWLGLSGAVPCAGMPPINLNTAEDFIALDRALAAAP